MANYLYKGWTSVLSTAETTPEKYAAVLKFREVCTRLAHFVQVIWKAAEAAKKGEVLPLPEFSGPHFESTGIHRAISDLLQIRQIMDISNVDDLRAFVTAHEVQLEEEVRHYDHLPGADWVPFDEAMDTQPSDGGDSSEKCETEA